MCGIGFTHDERPCRDRCRRPRAASGAAGGLRRGVGATDGWRRCAGSAAGSDFALVAWLALDALELPAADYARRTAGVAGCVALSGGCAWLARVAAGALVVTL